MKFDYFLANELDRCLSLPGLSKGQLSCSQEVS